MDSRKQILFSLCGPGGSGKSSLSRKLVSDVPGLKLSISTTTRTPRPGEVDGIHYNFITVQEFRERIERGMFLEHAEFNGNLYGTEKSNLDLARAADSDLLLDIDFQGAKHVKSFAGDAAVTVFLFPPTMQILEERLRARASDSNTIVTQRLELARQEFLELSSPKLSDYFVVNDDFTQAVEDLTAIIRSERLNLSRIDPAYLQGFTKL